MCIIKHSVLEVYFRILSIAKYSKKRKHFSCNCTNIYCVLSLTRNVTLHSVFSFLKGGGGLNMADWRQVWLPYILWFFFQDRIKSSLTQNKTSSIKFLPVYVLSSWKYFHAFYENITTSFAGGIKRNFFTAKENLHIINIKGKMYWYMGCGPVKTPTSH